MAKKMSTKVFFYLVACTILMSMVSLLAFTVGDTVTAQHDLVYTLEGTELGYDDGEADGIAPMAPHGPAVLFENNRKLDILGIKICGVRFGNVSRNFEIEIWDSNFKTLYSASYDYTDYFPDSYTPPEFSDLKWVTINIPNIEVNSDFYIAVFTYSGSWRWSPPIGGIGIGCDKDTKFGNSFVVVKDPNRFEDWPTKFPLQENTDWMIRVVTAQGTSTSKTIYVDDDFTDDPINHEWNTIQEGIDDADSGDTIIVKSGIYPEHLVIDKRVTLKGEEYPTVDGEGIETVISIRTDRVHIDGLNVIRCDPARENMEVGIRVSVNNCVINDCIISDHNIGLSTGGKDNVISNCKFNDNRISLVIHNGERNTVKKNHFTNGGIILDNAKNNLITSNIIGLDSRISIYNKSEYNTIEGNSLGAIDIVVSEWGPTSHNNKIYHNNILGDGCKCQAYDDGNNLWDNGYPSGGNYWSDYAGTDADGDGIGDTPYNIDGGTGAQDRYPFIQMISDGTNDVEDMREIIEEVEKLRDKSISKINRDVDSTATVQAKIGKEVYDKEEKNIVINSLQHALGLLSADDNILNYLAEFTTFKMIDIWFDALDKDTTKQFLNIQTQVDVGYRDFILPDSKKIQDFAVYNTGKENRLIVLTELGDVEIYRYDFNSGKYMYVQNVFPNSIGLGIYYNVGTGDIDNDGFDDLLLIHNAQDNHDINIYFYDPTIAGFNVDNSKKIDLDATIFDVTVGDIDNNGNNELILSLKKYGILGLFTEVLINIYQFDGNHFNTLLNNPFKPDIGYDNPYLAIGNVDNDESNGNELVISDKKFGNLYRYNENRINAISRIELCDEWNVGGMAIGDIDDELPRNELVASCSAGKFSFDIHPLRYNAKTEEFDKLPSLDASGLGGSLKIIVGDSTNTGFNNIIFGLRDDIRSYHYEENKDQLEDYLEAEYKDAFLYKEGGPKYAEVIENIDKQYNTFLCSIEDKDLTGYPTNDVLEYLKEQNNNLDTSSYKETNLLVLKPAEMTSEIRKIGTINNEKVSVNKLLNDLENTEKSSNNLVYLTTCGKVVQAVLVLKTGGAPLIVKAFIISTIPVEYLNHFDKLSINENLQLHNFALNIELYNEVSTTNDLFENALSFILEPTINSIEVIEWPDETCIPGTDLPCGVWLEINEGDTFGHGKIVVKVKNNGENLARVNLFAEVYDYSDIIAISSSKEFTEISAGEYEVIDLELNVPGIKEWGHNYYSPYRMKIYATSSSSMIGLPWQRSIPLYVDTKQGLDAAKL